MVNVQYGAGAPTKAKGAKARAKRKAKRLTPKKRKRADSSPQASSTGSAGTTEAKGRQARTRSVCSDRYSRKSTDTASKFVEKRKPISKELTAAASRVIKKSVADSRLQVMLKPMVPQTTTKDIRVNRKTGKKKARPLTAADFCEDDRVREVQIRARAAKAASTGFAFKCLVCEKQFRSRVGFTYHMRQNVCYKRAQRAERDEKEQKTRRRTAGRPRKRLADEGKRQRSTRAGRKRGRKPRSSREGDKPEVEANTEVPRVAATELE